MRMVGERAGVSPTAVSMALRNHPSIPPRTCQRIQKIAAEMGYRPNPLVSALMASIHTKRTQLESPVLALIVEENMRRGFEVVPFYIALLEGVRTRAANLGYVLEEFPLGEGKNAGRHLHRVLINRNIRGAILAPVSGQDGQIRLPLDGLACCALGHSLRTPPIHRVGSHYRQSMDLVWNEVTARGYQRSGYIQLQSQLGRGQIDRLGTFLARQAMNADSGGVPPLILAESPDEKPELCLEDLLRWFEKHRPDVLIGPPWILLEGLTRKLRIPEDTGVVIFDFEEGWTRVREPAENIGAGAVDMVVAQIHRNETGVPLFPKTVLVESTWVEGTTLPSRK
jgi:LacI family transcriptional regulator